MVSCAFSPQGDVTARWISGCVLALGDVRDGRYSLAVLGFRVQPHRAITSARHAFSRVEAKQVSTRDLVKYAPDFLIRVGAYVGGRGLALRTAFKIEAQPAAGETANPAFQRRDAAPLDKGSHMHVGPIGEVPDFVRWSPVQHETMSSIVPAR